MAEIRPVSHRITIDQRERTVIDGVTDVISFDEESIVCETDMGTVFVRGAGLHVEKLNLDQGELDITGTVDRVEYGEEGALSKGGGILGRIFK